VKVIETIPTKNFVGRGRRGLAKYALLQIAEWNIRKEVEKFVCMYNVITLPSSCGKKSFDFFRSFS
jgi:hypothetical protein